MSGIPVRAGQAFLIKHIEGEAIPEPWRSRPVLYPVGMVFTEDTVLDRGTSAAIVTYWEDGLVRPERLNLTRTPRLNLLDHTIGIATLSDYHDFERPIVAGLHAMWKLVPCPVSVLKAIVRGGSQPPLPAPGDHQIH